MKGTRNNIPVKFKEVHTIRVKSEIKVIDRILKSAFE